MVNLTQLQIQSVRNLDTTDLHLDPGFNLFEGSNGSGKTSILESVFLLSRGRSFRTRDIRRVIADDADQLIVSALVQEQERKHRLGFQRSASSARFRLDGKELRSLSELVSHLPARFIGPDVHQLVSGLPAIRRSFMDWGLFHVKPQSHSVMMDFRKTLKQRNAALQRNERLEVIRSLDPLFIQYAETLISLREQHVSALKRFWPKEIIDCLGFDEIQIEMRSGIPNGATLKEALKMRLDKDRNQGFTNYGPHRGDVMIRIHNRTGKGRLSRGQEKLVAIGLLLAQSALLQQERNRSAIFLLDDLASELDSDSQASVITSAKQQKAQFLITTLPGRQAPLGEEQVKRFHVEQGCITPH